MEASARETGVRQRTEEDNLQTKGLARLKRQEDSDSDSDSDANSVTESDASGEFDEALLLAGLNIREEGGGGGGVLDDETNERAALDAQFEAVSCFDIFVRKVSAVATAQGWREEGRERGKKEGREGRGGQATSHKAE